MQNDNKEYAQYLRKIMEELDTYAHVTTAMQSNAANTISNFFSRAIQ